MAKTQKFSTTCIEVKQSNRSFVIASLPVSVIAKIAYTSVRNIDNEEGSVQRVLEPGRLKEIKEFTLAGGDYPASIILNWVSDTNPIKKSGGKIHFFVRDKSAQLVDGQHRVEGLREALKENPKTVGKIELPVTIYNGLSTTECADIFISINDKQRQVKKSLVVDLYNVASDYVVDIVAQRARDLAENLNTYDHSPYREYIKFPNARRGSFGIPLSTVVSNIKPLIESQGVFEQVGLTELKTQTACIINFFTVLRDWYRSRWDDRSNVFLTAAGFTGAIDFLKNTVTPYCNLAKDFTADYINQGMQLEHSSLIERSDLSGLQGRAAWNKVQHLLKDRFKASSEKRKIRV